MGADRADLGNLFRRESGRLVSALTRIFGLHNLTLAEDVVQDALCQALAIWKLRGPPDNPGAWLLSAAKNRAIDVLRRDNKMRAFAPDLSRLLESEWTLVPTIDDLLSDDLIRDDQLRMMFSCCHPKLGDEARVAVMLSLLCGFGTREVATAFLTAPAAMEKRIQRAKRTMAQSGRLFEVSSAVEVTSRLGDVLRALYLLFNEGYHGSHPERTVREELCEEAMRLCGLLAEHETARTPETCALFALMCLHAARLPGRLDEAGELAALEDQDRSKWDRGLIERGLDLLESSASGERLTPYHVEAAIASEHAAAKSVRETNWSRIVGLYDVLYGLRPTPVVALNRAVALAQRDGPEKGLAELERLAHEGRLSQYPFLEAARGELERQAGHLAAARAHFLNAADLARGDLERRFLQRRALACASETKRAEN